ncbi:MAG: LamG domain-containing protein, partial [Planctomycetota bacterium]|nr:LamG domain-containing protein [Planctomycetota bacterium]
IGDGQWHHLAVALDGKVLRCYLDGAALPPRDVPGADVRMEGTWAIAVMGSPWNGCTVGAMDDFRYYNRAISPEDAAQLAKR